MSSNVEAIHIFASYVSNRYIALTSFEDAISRSFSSFIYFLDHTNISSQLVAIIETNGDRKDPRSSIFALIGHLQRHYYKPHATICYHYHNQRNQSSLSINQCAKKKEKNIIANLLYEYIDRTVQIKHHKYREINSIQSDLLCRSFIFYLEEEEGPWQLTSRWHWKAGRLPVSEDG